MSRSKKKLSYISVPSRVVDSLASTSLHSFLISPKKPKASSRVFASWPTSTSPRLWFLTLFMVGLFGMLRVGYKLNTLVIPISSYPCSTLALSRMHALVPREFSRRKATDGQEASVVDVRHPAMDTHQLSVGRRLIEADVLGNDHVKDQHDRQLNSMARLGIGTDVEDPNDHGDLDSEDEFWKQPDGMGYRACLEFSNDYRRDTIGLLKDRRKYLIVVASGGLNQQRNQIVDAVVIARILGAALVMPILQVNLIWGDESEFSDIFDLDHFKRVLADDVRIVSSLPSKHLRTKPLADNLTPAGHITPEWIRARYHRKLERVGVLLLRGLDSRLSKDLPSDLQKLRCKAAFQALRFAPEIQKLGDRLADRMRSKGPFLALHLRMEKDVWVRTGCFPSLSHKYDELINIERQRHPELLTGKSNMTYTERKLAGLCPLTATEVTRLLKALKAPRNARIYWAGGQPLGGKEALLPLIREYPNFYNKEDIALAGELKAYAHKASVMAAVDYIICEKSDVFMPSHGGNMGHALQGQRAYAGHKKYITPNKRQMLPYFLNESLPQPEFDRIIWDLHRDSMGQPDFKIGKLGRDVTKFPIPECMCNSSSSSTASS